MASGSTTAGDATSSPKGETSQTNNNAAALPDPVEMSTLQSQPDAPAEPPSTEAPVSPPVAATTESQPAQESTEKTTPSSDAHLAPPPASSPPAARPEQVDPEAIGPSTDTPITPSDPTGGPVVIITLLLQSGARHPYKIDEKYLRKRNVNVEDMNPYNISVYTLKELIWRDWREDWEPRPTSPSFIRLISFGRMLDDKQPLKECRFQTESPNVVHMTVKPQEIIDDEDTKTSKGGPGRDRGTNERSAGCRCVIL